MVSTIRTEALRLGFVACGVARADVVDKAHQQYFLDWLQKGGNAEMHYMERYQDLRFDPRLLHPGTRSIISVAMASSLECYHEELKNKLHLLCQNVGLSGYRVFVDSAPVLERYWAQKAGLGWIGRNHNLIIPQKGSQFYLGEIFTDLEMDYDMPMDSRCGECDICIKTCPGRALGEWFDAAKCISYLTIEDPRLGPARRNPEYAKQHGLPYGCLRCQQACPHC